MIDMGGPLLLRASAKNYDSITTISSPKDYKSLEINIKNNSGGTDLNFRKKMAEQTFRLTYEYDKEIHNWFSKNNQQNDIKLRYGENPNQMQF